MESTTSAPNKVLSLDSVSFHLLLWWVLIHITSSEKTPQELINKVYKKGMGKEAILASITPYLIEEINSSNEGEKIKSFNKLVNEYYPHIRNKKLDEYFGKCEKLEKMKLDIYIQSLFDGV